MARRKVNPPDPNVIARVTHRKPKKPHEKRIAKDKDFHFQNHSFSFWVFFSSLFRHCPMILSKSEMSGYACPKSVRVRDFRTCPCPNSCPCLIPLNFNHFSRSNISEFLKKANFIQLHSFSVVHFPMSEVMSESEVMTWSMSESELPKNLLSMSDSACLKYPTLEILNQ